MHEIDQNQADNSGQDYQRKELALMTGQEIENAQANLFSRLISQIKDLEEIMNQQKMSLSAQRKINKELNLKKLSTSSTRAS